MSLPAAEEGNHGLDDPLRPVCPSPPQAFPIIFCNIFHNSEYFTDSYKYLCLFGRKDKGINRLSREAEDLDLVGLEIGDVDIAARVDGDSARALEQGALGKIFIRDADLFDEADTAGRDGRRQPAVRSGVFFCASLTALAN